MGHEMSGKISLPLETEWIAKARLLVAGRIRKSLDDLIDGEYADYEIEAATLLGDEGMQTVAARELYGNLSVGKDELWDYFTDKYPDPAERRHIANALIRVHIALLDYDAVMERLDDGMSMDDAVTSVVESREEYIQQFALQMRNEYNTRRAHLN
jgi:hypothetical protein